ncbi:MAG: heme transporter HemC [Bradyrhizobium sp.]|uniref:cytochrome c biogenesis protein CcsA n=1 Tax=Bradyrhizobium sp. TaxID=376 RepID=UPI001216142A|nr:cytochrome c biogenesis protein CcsA [Bradyrhizobium sp.]THD63342.1 MAG: heme transporter HemC [Bradyrhizobium sp.]
MALIDLANPSRFLAFAGRALPWLWGATIVTFAVTCYRVLNLDLAVYEQQQTIKIMFIHVPTAWLGMFGWASMSLAALGTLVWRHPLADVAAKATAPIGAAFTFVCFVTGWLWGRASWAGGGNLPLEYMVLDARLSSVLMLLILYLVVIALVRAIEDPSRAARAAAILTLVGAINLPIIKLSAEWREGQYTLHQTSSVFLRDGPKLDTPILTTLLISALAFTLLFVTLQVAAMRNEILRRRVRALRLMQAEEQRA